MLARQDATLKCTVPGHPLHQGIEFSAQGAGDDAMEKGGCGRAADAIRDSSSEWSRATGGIMPRVWDFPSDRLSVASAVPADAQHHQRGGTEPTPPRKSTAHRSAQG